MSSQRQPDRLAETRQALQELLAAVEEVANVIPGGLREGLALHKAIQNARRYA
jgi:isopentenyl diphosphate isomerase/L-lactate dehydrogenase-like FMN-dependent dehydrogenase